jgi:hypothetical protein
LLAVPTAIAVLVRGILYLRERTSAAITMFVVRDSPTRPHPGSTLIVKNEGPGSACITNLEHLEPGGNDFIARYWSDYASSGVELLAREEHYVPLTMTFGTPWPIRVRVTWSDGRRSTRSRVRVLSLPP